MTYFLLIIIFLVFIFAQIFLFAYIERAIRSKKIHNLPTLLKSKWIWGEGDIKDDFRTGVHVGYLVGIVFMIFVYYISRLFL
ncbi:MAG: hypothetical protein A3D67_03405 [Candidatus Lloydbacteria bacterium RIFCSPHIGHO2_02_FULL_51_22]|uniref:Uncharacterized protein n=2 Tax=Candidatus Lloydiibacteriota TaxID=1817910 RepID=A0A1G2DD07_9BACT|nr:MAG: hypothetical protein A3D67_03405 [Candidatus Lloydbacteria bacterium RIFCSPHIGHO2_02_FULL_51_22]OGZ14042.1 MAG: hypothetical protein A3J08_03890 [Candidatus Lloydbacteria bacterium RIFCSPLOWO2_02_FULL_51_11]